MKPIKELKVISSYKNPRSFVFVIKDDIIPKDDQTNSLNLLKLRHPKTGEGAYFALNTKVHEILKFSDEKRSYFIDENVASNGDLYLSTPIDPLFLILPYLMKSKHFCPLNQILIDDEFPDVERLEHIINVGQLNHISDKKGNEELVAFIFNEDKALIWLRKKINRIVEMVKAKGIHVASNSAVSANFVKSEQEKDSEESYLVYSLGLLSDYLPTELTSKLAEFIGISSEERQNDEDNGKRIRDNSAEELDDCKKIKFDADFEILQPHIPPTVKAEKKQSTKEQAMAKAAKGTKSISSFFRKK